MRTTQRDVMRNLFRRFGGDRDKVIAAYAAAERRGEVTRVANLRHMEPEEYAARLLRRGGCSDDRVARATIVR